MTMMHAWYRKRKFKEEEIEDHRSNAWDSKRRKIGGWPKFQVIFSFFQCKMERRIDLLLISFSSPPSWMVLIAAWSSVGSLNPRLSRMTLWMEGSSWPRTAEENRAEDGIFSFHEDLSYAINEFDEYIYFSTLSYRRSSQRFLHLCSCCGPGEKKRQQQADQARPAVQEGVK